MSFCEHCEGQRFDRAQVLRLLRAARKGLRTQDRVCSTEAWLDLTIRAVRALDIPHLEPTDEPASEQVVH